MAGILKIFQKKKTAVESEPVHNKPLNTSISETLPKKKAPTRTGPYTLPPLDDWSFRWSMQGGSGHIAAPKDIKNTKNTETKPQGGVVTPKDLKGFESKDKKKEEAVTRTKKHASLEDPSKASKRLSYKQHLKKLIGSEPDSDDDIQLWEHSDLESEDEEAIRNARSRGF